MNMTLESYNLLLGVMAVLAAVVFVALYFVKAGYGMFCTKAWGISLSNKVAWVLMEAPVFVVMTWLWAVSERSWQPVPLVMFLLFQLHYFQRSFVFPFLMKGKSRMPVAIMLMGVVFNVINGFVQGEWIFFLAPATCYSAHWFTSWQFVLGVCLFFAGMAINWHSDYVIRHLRKPGDTKHYLPQKGMYRYVTSGNYFGELLEWFGWAVLTWSWAGLLFFVWTFANLVPRAHAIWKRYHAEFGEAVGNRKRVIPFIY